MALRPAAFIDKDGTLVENVPYNVDASRVVLTRDAVRGLAMLADAGYVLVVVSNQPGIALGRFGFAELGGLREALVELLARQSVRLDGFYFCPHHPAGALAEYSFVCECRKPAPGMLRRAAAELGIDLGRSWMIGDILDDVEAGRRAGCRTVLLDVGNETEWQLSRDRVPHYRVPDLGQAAEIIVGRRGAAAAVAGDARALATEPLA